MKNKQSTVFIENVIFHILALVLVFVCLLAVMTIVTENKLRYHNMGFDAATIELAEELDKKYILGQGDKFVNHYADFQHMNTCVGSLKEFLREAEKDVGAEKFRALCKKASKHQKGVERWRSISFKLIAVMKFIRFPADDINEIEKLILGEENERLN